MFVTRPAQLKRGKESTGTTRSRSHLVLTFEVCAISPFLRYLHQSFVWKLCAWTRVIALSHFRRLLTCFEIFNGWFLFDKHPVWCHFCCSSLWFTGGLYADRKIILWTLCWVNFKAAARIVWLFFSWLTTFCFWRKKTRSFMLDPCKLFKYRYCLMNIGLARSPAETCHSDNNRIKELNGFVLELSECGCSVIFSGSAIPHLSTRCPQCAHHAPLEASPDLWHKLCCLRPEMRKIEQVCCLQWLHWSCSSVGGVVFWSTNTKAQIPTLQIINSSGICHRKFTLNTHYSIELDRTNRRSVETT